MVYHTKSCPHCGFHYSIMQPAKSGFYGSPFRTCSICRKSFIDKDYREIAVSGIRSVDTQRVSTSTALLSIFPALFFAAGLYCCFSVGFSPSSVLITAGGAVVLAIVIWLMFSEARGYEQRQQYLKQESEQSEARLRNPEYALALKKLGYHVPEKYLIKFEGAAK